MKLKIPDHEKEIVIPGQEKKIKAQRIHCKKILPRLALLFLAGPKPE